MNRLEAITDALATKGVDAILISDLKNVRYLSGFSGSNGCLLITKGEYFFFTDPR
jgi:Xaa-Pro aminopeptidase